MTDKQRVLQIIRDQPEDSSYDEILRELAFHRKAPFKDNPALHEAVREGWITPATASSDAPPARKPVAPLEEILKDLDEDRKD